MSYSIWLIIGLILLGCETFLPSGYFLMFLGGAGVLVGALTYVGVLTTLSSQTFVFSVLAVLLLLLFWKKMFSGSRGRHYDSDADSLVGLRGIVTEPIAFGGFGRVELRGAEWNSRNIGEAELNTGDAVVVTAVDGITLHVMRE